MADKLITTEKFNKSVDKWKESVRSESYSILATNTKGVDLKDSLEGKARYVDDEDKAYNRIGFTFLRHGVFVHYGVGRGYTRVNGVVVRGYNLWNAKKKKWRNDAIASRKAKEGFSTKEMKKIKIPTSMGAVYRRPLNFLDKVIDQKIEELADLSGEYYGDNALRKILNTYDKLKIEKYGKK
nr:MAG TPA: hypothetical protein [Caudoviricetes sp.]